MYIFVGKKIFVNILGGYHLTELFRILPTNKVSSAQKSLAILGNP